MRIMSAMARHARREACMGFSSIITASSFGRSVRYSIDGNAVISNRCSKSPRNAQTRLAAFQRQRRQPAPEVITPACMQ